MNISTAAHYMSLGYKTRRSCWIAQDFLSFKDDKFILKTFFTCESTDHLGVIKYTEEMSTSYVFSFSIEDLIADDWELIFE